MITIDRNDKTPIYIQIYKHIVNEIISGKLPENSALPSKRVLAEKIGVSIITVENTYQLLLDEGYVFSKPKSGYYVCKISALENIPNQSPVLSEPKKQQFKYDFSTNSVDTAIFPYRTWSRIFKDELYNNPSLLNHGDGRGDYSLRHAISDYISSNRGVISSPSQIVVGAGVEYLMSVLVKLLGNDAVYAVENPGYAKTGKIIANNGGKLVYIDVDDKGMDIAMLAKSKANIAYVTPSHQFPLGITMPIGRRSELINWCRKGNYIIEDDYNSEFSFSTKPMSSLQGLEGGNRTIYISTFSRIIAPSIRVAYMVLPKQLSEKYDEFFGDYSSTVSRFEQSTLTKFITGGYLSRHINRSKKFYKERRDIIEQQFKECFPSGCYTLSGDSTGLHFIFHFVSTQSELELTNIAASNNIKISGVSAYYAGTQKKCRNPSFLIGYSTFDLKKAHKAVSALSDIWLE